MRRKPIYYGWIVMGAAWLVYFLTTTPPAYGSSAILTHLVMSGELSKTLSAGRPVHATAPARRLRWSQAR